MEPLYEHDSDCCTYLGQLRQKDGPYRGLYDLYYCPQMGSPTVLARWSSSGPDYYSGVCFASPDRNPLLFEALNRAQDAGLSFEGAMF